MSVQSGKNNYTVNATVFAPFRRFNVNSKLELLAPLSKVNTVCDVLTVLETSGSRAVKYPRTLERDDRHCTDRRHV